MIRFVLLAVFSFIWLINLVWAESLQEKAEQIHRSSQQPGEGVVIGISSPAGRSYGWVGALALGGPVPDQDTLFEIGSITKVFTALLLAETVREGKARFKDPVGKFLPPEAIGPQSPLLDVITLESLATHASGLPRLPGNLQEDADPANPYAHYDTARLYTYLKTLQKSDLKTLGQNSYSNLGVGLLGHVLERIWNQPLPQLMSERVFVPLGMKATFLPTNRENLPAEIKSKLATGHVGGIAVPFWDLGVLAGAGAALSSVRDLLTFGEAHWDGAAPEGLRASMVEAVRLRSGPQALGWMREEALVSHSGGTGGFRSHIEVNLDEKTVRVELFNSAGQGFEEESQGDFSAITGFWSGVLETPAIKLRLVHYIDASGRAVAFSLDQGCGWSHASKTRFADGSLELSFPAVGGQYSGKFENSQFTGTWHQSGDLPLNFIREKGIPESLQTQMAKKITGNLSSLRGYWSGKLGGEKGLFVYLKVNDAGGIWLCDLHSPDQTPSPFGVSTMQVNDGGIIANWAVIDGTYRANFDLEKKFISGTWSQSGVDQPLDFKWSATRPR
jgi:serine-type D-Ala-D-Ala carboxypeptidase/endopeptidase